MFYIAVVSVILFLCWQVSFSGNSEITLRTGDKSILLTYDFIGLGADDKIQILIKDCITEKVVEEYISPNEKRFQFENGVHGNRYSFAVSLMKNNEIVETLSGKAMFLDYAKMPKFPILQIDTLDGKNVQYEKVMHSVGHMGKTIRNNSYSDAVLHVFQSGNLHENRRVRIKARGNYSAYGFLKLPYMLQFDEDFTFSSDGEKYSSKKIILLNFYDLQFVFGNYLNMKVQGFDGPKYFFVNVIFNGDYKGSYIAVEPVSEYLLRDGVVAKTGAIIENDQYWWNEKLAFSTVKQISLMAYIFKYPKISSRTDWRYKRVKNFVCDFEKALFEKGEEYADFIDENSFVNWLLLHDIMQIWDGRGSNMFMYLKDLDDKSKLTMGPSWDFDSIYFGSVEGKWEDIHCEPLFYFPTLFGKNSFVKNYERRWKKLHNNILADTTEYFTSFEKQYADDVDESWYLNSVRWGDKQSKVREQICWSLSKLNNRLNWMDKKIKAKEYVK